MAYPNFWGSSLYSPEMLLQNEWFIFGGIFIVSFSLIYLALFRAFMTKPTQIEDPIRAALFPPRDIKGNRGPITVMSLVISLFIASAISQRVTFYGYIGQDIGSWILFFAYVIIIALTIWASFKTPGAGPVLGFVSITVIWLILKSVDFYSILPYNIAYGAEEAYYILISVPGLIAAFILAGVGLAIANRNRREAATR